MSSEGQIRFRFPILRKADIVSCMRELEFPMTEKDLENPSPNQLTAIYESFVVFLMGIPQQGLRQAQFSGMDSFEHPDLYDEPAGRVLFVRSLAQLMSVAGINDFSVLHLVKPTEKQTRRYLSALINFAKFREGKLAIYSEAMDRNSRLSRDEEALKIENTELKTAFQNLKVQKEEETEEVNIINAELNAMRTDLAELNQDQAVKTAETEALKTKFKSLRDEFGVYHSTAAKKVERCNTLQSQIISSPQKYRSNIEDLRKSLETIKNEQVAAETRFHALQSKQTYLEKAKKQIENVIALMDETESEKSKWKDMKEQVREYQEECRTTQRELVAAKNAKEVLLQQLRTSEERFDAVKDQNNAKLSALQENKQLLNQRKAELETEQQLIRDRVDQHHRKAREYHVEQNRVLDSHAKSMAALGDEEKLLKENMDIFQNRVHQLTS